MFYFPRYDPIGTVYDVMVRFTSDLRTSMHLAASSAKIWEAGARAGLRRYSKCTVFQ